MKALLILCVVLCSFSACKKCYVCSSKQNLSYVPTTTYCSGLPDDSSFNNNYKCHVKLEAE